MTYQCVHRVPQHGEAGRVRVVAHGGQPRHERPVLHFAHVAGERQHLTAMKKLRIVRVGFGTARQKRVLE
jgi:hypothetical protein